MSFEEPDIVELPPPPPKAPRGKCRAKKTAPQASSQIVTRSASKTPVEPPTFPIEWLHEWMRQLPNFRILGRGVPCFGRRTALSGSLSSSTSRRAPEGGALPKWAALFVEAARLFKAVRGQEVLLAKGC